MTKTNYHLWDQPVLDVINLELMVEDYLARGTSKIDAFRFVAEEIFVRLKGPKLTASQVQNRYAYLKKRRQKMGSKAEAEVQAIIDRPELEEELAKVDEPEENNYPTITSTVLVDIHNHQLNLNKFTYSLIDGERLAREIQKLYFIQQKRNNKVDMNTLLESLAGFFNVKEKTLYSRYYSNLRKLQNNKEKVQLEKDTIKALKSQVESLNKTADLEREFHLQFRDKLTTAEKQVMIQADKIRQLQEQSLIEFIKMKIQNCNFKNIWRRINK